MAPESMFTFMTFYQHFNVQVFHNKKTHAMDIIMTWVLGLLESWVYDHIHGSSVVTCLF